ncbi:MAG: methyltransferase domain-containing protein, partial [Oscillatoria sp. PMC 1068.18]|nr:methyltransferase domain-containing protein [Oscillatoria sp. PMC 1068.18]
YYFNKLINKGKPIKLHLGCGSDYFPGYINIDAYPDSQADLVMKVEELSLFPDNCVEIIESYHLFEHLYLEQARQAIAEWFRLLQPEGILVLELPNLAVSIQELGKHFGKKNIDIAMVGIYGYPPDIKKEGVGQLHKWGWTPETLKYELEKVGFTEISQYPVKQNWRRANKFGRDMQIRAIKPKVTEAENHSLQGEKNAVSR